MNKILLLSLLSVGSSTALAGVIVVSSGFRNTPSTQTSAIPSPSPSLNASPASSGSGDKEPNDPYFYLQRLTFNLINARKILQKDEGRGIIVAVIDTGVAFGPDLNPNKFVPGYDFVEGRVIKKPEESTDMARHGSFIAATIAQSTNNGIGTVGLAPDSKIMPVRVLNATSRGFPERLNDAIRYAVDHGADIINLSLAEPLSNDSVLGAIRYAYRNNVVVIAASGNEYGKSKSYPAAYEEVLGVGAITQSGQIASYSNRASIYAVGGSLLADPTSGKSESCETPKIIPGAEPDPRLVGGIFQMITVTVDGAPESRLIVCQGTSYAAGVLTGVASPVKSSFKTKGIQSSEAVFQVILESAKYSNGIRVLDADEAIQLTQLLTMSPTQLSESEKARVNAFAESLKQRGEALLEDGKRSMSTSKIRAAFVIYTDVDKLSADLKISDWDWNKICWSGSLVGGIRKEKEFIVKIMPACEQAVTLGKLKTEHNYYQAMDSRGIAKALAGNFAGAARDLKAASESNELSAGTEERRNEWVITLSTGRNPFTRSVLESLLIDNRESGDLQSKIPD